MRPVTTVVQLALSVALIAMLGACRAPALAQEPVIPAGMEREVAKVAAPYQPGGEVADGFLLNGVGIGRRRIELVLERTTGSPERVTLALTARGQMGEYDLSIDPAAERQSPAARRAVTALKEAVVRNADADFWRLVLRAPGQRIASQPWVPVCLWIALAAALVALLRSLLRSGVRWPPAECIGVLVWSVFVRFALTEPNILTDGGSGYRRLLEYLPGYGGLSVLIRTVLPDGSRFMWTALCVPWVLSALAAPTLVLLARVLGFSRGAALFAGVALASLPLHAAMYSSDFMLGALLTLQLLGLALVAGAVRFERADLGFAGAAVLAYTCWGRPDAPGVGAVLLAIALPGLFRRRVRPALAAALAWFGGNALASLMAVRASGATNSIAVHLRAGLWPTLPFAHFLTLQAIVPFWCWVPFPFGIVRLARRDWRRLAVVAVGIVAGFAPAFLRGGMPDRSRSYMEFFRYGTWALPWILLATAEGMEATVLWVKGRFDDARALRIGQIVRVTIIAVCAATPLVFRDYLSRRYGPSAEEEVFRAALRHVPSECTLIVPDDESEDQHGGTVEILNRYQYIAVEATRSEHASVGPPIVGVTSFLRSLGRGKAFPPADSDSPDATTCWYYFHGSFCYTGIDGRAPAVCAGLERRAVLQPVLHRDILYISHRLVTRPDLRDPPLYDAAQTLELSKLVGLRADDSH